MVTRLGEARRKHSSDIEELRARLEEAEETLGAIRSGAVDALVVSGENGEQVFTLQGAEHPYRVMVEAMNEGAATLMSDGTILYCNRRLAMMLKAPLETLIGSSFFRFILPGNMKPLQALLEGEKNGDGKQEVTLRCEDGSLVTAQLSVSALQVRDVQSLCIVATDLTRQKHVEEALGNEIGFVKLLQAIASASNESSTIEAAMQTAIDTICAHTGWPLGHAYMLAEDATGELAPTTIWHVENPERLETFLKVTENTRFAPGLGLPGRILSGGKPAWISDVTQDLNFPRVEAARESGVRAGFGFPVLVEKEVVAVLEFFSVEPIEPNERLLEVMSQIGTQLGRVVERRRSEEMLQKVKEELERRVLERTKELIEINEALKKENRERKKVEEQLRTIYNLRDAVERAETVEQVYEETLNSLKSVSKADKASILLFDGNGLMRFKAWRGLSDAYRNQVEGHSPWSADELYAEPILIPNAEQADLGPIRPIILGEGIRALAFIPLDYQGRLLGKFMIYFDEPHKFTDNEVQLLQTMAGHVAHAIERKSAGEEIKAALKEKEILLREIHHRVKNNLQVISSLIKLQSKSIEDETIREKLKESQNRVKSMAIIHERLYESVNLAGIDFKGYTKHLAQDLFRSYGTGPNIKIKTDIDSVFLNIDKAVPLGLILNELISNSLKHAFPDGRKGEIRILLHQDNGGNYSLIVSDNGAGLPSHMDFRNTKSLGLQLVNALTKQLKGNIELDSSNGTQFSITFSH